MYACRTVTVFVLSNLELPLRYLCGAATSRTPDIPDKELGVRSSVMRGYLFLLVTY